MSSLSHAPGVETLFNLNFVTFIIGNLLGMGLDVALSDTRMALAFLLLSIMLRPSPYGVGLMLLCLAPCAPFLPMVARKAGGDLAYAVALMLLTASGIVISMPLAGPILVRGFSADTWAIAKPIVLFISIPLLPIAAAMAVGRTAAETSAGSAAAAEVSAFWRAVRVVLDGLPARRHARRPGERRA